LLLSSSSHSNGLLSCGVLLHWPNWVVSSSSVGVSLLPVVAVKNMRINNKKEMCVKLIVFNNLEILNASFFIFTIHSILQMEKCDPNPIPNQMMCHRSLYISFS
jgi:hypothetical protein